MARAADEADGLHRQQCIDVLCGYLRLPYDAVHGTSGRTKFVVKEPRIEHGRVRGETEEHVEYRQNDSEVRKTIVRVIADRLRPEAEYSWSASDFDFRTAHLEDVDLSHATFAGDARFDEARFTGGAWFDKARFTGDAWFDKATFTGDAWFNEATFTGDAWFNEATFVGGAWFTEATFTGDAGFTEVRFTGGAWFNEARFTGDAWFNTATFTGGAWFTEATFTGDAGFNTATFTGDAGFNEVMFAGKSSFVAADFGSGRIAFIEPRQWGPPPPEFDWGEDGRRKPSNVEPQIWPPVTAAP
ncbi:pentapeptide repeat-containing protein [Nocardia sp. NPDC058518]|uniref:pentapeptide repeat-containing protein n=1 Tax=Nocardia sp. NPDC058518 TaxID=3346534 RepID=UPI0036524117